MSSAPPKHRRAGVGPGWVVAVALALVVPACGDDPDASGPVDAGGTTAAAAPVEPEVEPVLPVTIKDDTGTTVVVGSVQRIVPLDGDLAEVVFALGLGDRVVATDLSATHPPEADALPEIGYQPALAPEPIAAVEPTVALASDLAGPPETLDALRRIGIPLVVIDRVPGPSGPPAKVRRVAGALGVRGRGERLASEVERGIEAATVEPPAEPLRVAALYLRGDAVQLIFGLGSGTDWVIEAAGGVDVGTELGVVDSTPLATEALVEAAPDVFLVSTTGLESVGGIDGFLALPGMAETPAGAARRVVAFPDQLLFGGGPRTPELIAALAEELATPAAAVPDDDMEEET